MVKRIGGFILIGLLALAVGFFAHLPKERSIDETVITPTPSTNVEVPTTNPVPTASTTTESNATLSYGEIIEWLKTLPSTIQEDIEVAKKLTINLYQKRPTFTGEYQLYKRCTNYIIAQAVSQLTIQNLTALRIKPAAAAILVPGIHIATTDEGMKDGLLLSLPQEYIKTETAFAVGRNIMIQLDSTLDPDGSNQLATPSKSACKNMPVPAKYK